MQESKILQEQSEGSQRWTSASTPQAAKRGVVTIDIIVSMVVTDGPPPDIPVAATSLGTQSQYSIICYHTLHQLNSIMHANFCTLPVSDYSQDYSMSLIVNRSCEVMG